MFDLSSQFVYLFLLTIFMWVLVMLLHRLRYMIELIPLYGLISALVVYTHTLSSFGVNVVQSNAYFFVSSTAFFTPLLLGILLIYLFDGVEKARKGLEILIMVSLLQMLVIFSLSLIDQKNIFIESSFSNYKNYFWSITAMIADVIAVAILWELFSKFKRLTNFIKVPIVLFLVFMLDTFIFVTGVFWGQDFYLDIIKGDAMTRLGLSIIMGVIISLYLMQNKYKESERIKPAGLFDILNFNSVLMSKLQSLETDLVKEKELNRAKEIYQLAIDGSSIGIWRWNMKGDTSWWSDRFLEILGYERGEIKESYKSFKKIVYEKDLDLLDEKINLHLEKNEPFRLDCRVKIKSGNYKWVTIRGAAIREKGEPAFMVGSIQDITKLKNTQSKLSQELSRQKKMIHVMSNREDKILELKEEVKKLKKK